MTVKIKQDLETQLLELARSHQLALDELVERILREYLSGADETRRWVQSTQAQLGGVWSAEDFSDWQPPHARQAAF